MFLFVSGPGMALTIQRFASQRLLNVRIKSVCHHSRPGASILKETFESELATTNWRKKNIRTFFFSHVDWSSVKILSTAYIYSWQISSNRKVIFFFFCLDELGLEPLDL